MSASPSAAIITVSGAVAAGAAQDAAGPLLATLARAAGLDVVVLDALPDDRARIEARLRGLVDDVTPEATAAVIERETPGVAEALRAESLRHTPMGLLSRGLAGTAGQTLIVNLPGSPKAIEQVFGVLAPVLVHASATIRSSGGSRALHQRAADGGET